MSGDYEAMFIEAWDSGAITTSVPAYERDVAHAVALERERIAKWLDERWPKGLVSTDGEYRVSFMAEMGNAIRNGAHNEQEADQ